VRKIPSPGDMSVSSFSDNYYGRVFEKALSRVTFPNKDKFVFKTLTTTEFWVWTRIEAPDYSMPPEDRDEFQVILHRHGIPYSEIPTTEEEAVKFFVKLLFRIHMEILTHEAMESFEVDGERFRNPHSGNDKLYEGSRIGHKALGMEQSLWRNHVMWEACHLVAQESAPDFRPFWWKIIDPLLIWDDKITANLRLIAKIELYFLKKLSKWVLSKLYQIASFPSFRLLSRRIAG
jgi:hypothetical protein